MKAALPGLAPAARTVAWSALLAGAAACVAVLVLAPLANWWSAPGYWPGFGALALCTGAAFLLDDAAGATIAATPTSVVRRRLLRVVLALPLLCAVWAGSLWYATAADGAWFGPEARAALSLQFAAMLTLTLAASAIALRVRPNEHSGWTGVLAPFALVAAALVLPERWALLAAPGDSAWHAAQERWAALLALGLLTLGWANRDPVRLALAATIIACTLGAGAAVVAAKNEPRDVSATTMSPIRSGARPAIRASASATRRGMTHPGSAISSWSSVGSPSRSGRSRAAGLRQAGGDGRSVDDRPATVPLACAGRPRARARRPDCAVAPATPDQRSIPAAALPRGDPACR